MEQIIALFVAFFKFLTVQNILLLSVSSIAGIIIGTLPGLSATMGIALLTGLTYGLPTEAALIVLLGIYVGAIYGGSISAVLIGIPGTASAAATVLDGQPLAMRGEGGTALSLATIASFIGSLFGMVCLAGFTPLLQKLALNFTSAEYALLAIFGVLICGSLTAQGLPLKGWIGGFIGLAASCIGFEGIFGYPRYTFDVVGLMGGVAFVPAMIGMFGIPSLLSELSNKGGAAKVAEVSKGKGPGIFRMIKDYFPTILRSGLIGTGVGAIPGVGEDVAAWLSYDTARRTSKKSEEFGKGSYEGVIAAETANNAAIGGALIPLLSLAIPGSAPTAVLLGALWLHGIRPGPMLTFEFPNFIAEMSALLLLAALTMRIYGWIACQFAPKVVKVPTFILMPIVGVLSIIGSYALNINTFDLYVMFVFGIIGFLFEKMNYPAAPVVLGIILGPLADTNIRRTLQASGGSLAPFFTRPIALIVVCMIVYAILSQLKVTDKLFAWIKTKVLHKGKTAIEQ
ncbi:tripartite tricarboxylate transporter permease [Petroclostridium sp. X23]|uniref:tripartite tricarboxylate transporter permease n=1 Tax=Petroclostridium sp. X23 TaxID=3045146 RepID=UPI0024AD18D0|nr:tripartite tricarboxylate transporter permease [Petroclostridium sp. X23]WHH61493.1 tripartite tricarboxylate transporter permease [Petroclostridium sp. X23]